MGAGGGVFLGPSGEERLLAGFEELVTGGAGEREGAGGIGGGKVGEQFPGEVGAEFDVGQGGGPGVGRLEGGRAPGEGGGGGVAGAGGRVDGLAGNEGDRSAGGGGGIVFGPDIKGEEAEPGLGGAGARGEGGEETLEKGEGEAGEQDS